MDIAKYGLNTLQRQFIWWLLGLVGGGSVIGGILVVVVSVMVFASAQTSYMENVPPPMEDIPVIDGDLIFPLDDFRVTCGFTCYANHGGLDMSSGYGANVRAVMNGTVIKVVTGYVSDGGYLGHKGGYGNQVVIQHENGVQTRYAHLMDTIRVSVDDEVVIGQVIGQQGNSGNSSGSHLHFEWIENGVKVDPMTRLPFNQPKPPTDSEQNPTS